MCNPSKKTIKKIDRMLESRCKEHRTFGNALKMYIFRNPTEIGLDYVTFCGKAGYFIGVSLEESGEYNFFGIYSPEQERLWRSYRYVKQVLSCRSEQPGRLQ